MICRRCGGLMIRTGTCHTCTSCGDTDGCGMNEVEAGLWYLATKRPKFFRQLLNQTNVLLFNEKE